MKRILVTLILAVFVLPMTARADKKLKFVMVTKAVHPYYEPCYEGFKAAGAKYKVTVDRVDPQKMELPLQVKSIEELIAQKVAGIEAGKKMGALMKGEGKLVVLQGGLGAANLNLRTQGFKEALAKTAPKVKVLEVVDVGGDFSVATNKTEALLQTYPDLTAIFAV